VERARLAEAEIGRHRGASLPGGQAATLEHLVVANLTFAVGTAVLDDEITGAEDLADHERTK